MMDNPVVAILLFVALLILLRIVANLVRRSRESGPWPFYVKRILTQPEQVLYLRLVKALPDHIVLAQVQVSRVLSVKKGFRFHEWNNRINRLSYDFVICDKSSAVIAAIELDDKTHEREDAMIRDARKDKATTDAGLRLIRWNVKALPDESTIRRELLMSPDPLGEMQANKSPRTSSSTSELPDLWIPPRDRR